MITTTSKELVRVLHPNRFPGMSGKMAAIVGCLLGLDVIEGNGIAELCITSDGLLLARDEGDCGFNNILGSAIDITRNWVELLNTVEQAESDSLTPELRKEAEEIFSSGIQRGFEGPVWYIP